MDELERQRELLERTLDEFNRAGLVSADTMYELKNSTSSVNQTIKKAEDALERFNKNGLGKATKAAVDVAKGFISAGMAARDNRESLESLNPAIQGVASALRAIPIIGNALGNTLEGVGTFVTAEMQKNIESFNKLGSVGVLGAEGVTGLRQSAINAGLSLSQFANVVAQNSKALAFATGSTQAGALALEQISQAVGESGLRTQFRRLGFTLEEQQTGFADYLEFTRQIGIQQGRDYRSQASAAGQYLIELDKLARVTGESREQVQAELESQQSDARFLAAQRRAVARFGPEQGEEIARSMRSAVKIIESRAPELAEPIRDAFSGPNTEAARKFILLFGNEGQQALQALQTNRMTEYEFVETLQRLSVTAENRLGGVIGTIAKTGTPFEGVLLGLQQLSTSTGLTVDQLIANSQAQLDAKNATDNQTGELINAADSLQQFAIQMDRFVADSVMPRATTIVDKFADSLSSVTGAINKLAGVSGRATGGPITAGEPYIVGEEGPELIIPQVAGEVFTNKNTKAILDQYRNNIDVINEGRKMFETAFANQNVFNERPGPIETASGTSFDVRGDLGIEGYQLSGVAGKTLFDAQGNILQHVLPTFVEGLTSTLYANGNRSVEYAAGPVKIRALLDEQNQILQTMLGTQFAGNKTIELKNYQDGLVKSTNELSGYAQKLTKISKDGILLPNTDQIDRLRGAYENVGQPMLETGGIVSGPKSGYDATLHGTEAVVPLPNGKTIPVEESSTSSKKVDQQLDLMSQQLTKLDSVVKLLQSQNDTNRIMIRRTQA